jgi:peptide/nickel transport system ATP-binding protein/oligopeptide transport system ATP-binding protein
VTLLETRGVSVTFHTAQGPLQAVDRVDLGVSAGETVALVGESGCGKSTLARAIVGLEAPSAGEVRLDAGKLRAADGRRAVARFLQMVFQDPDASLNPRMTLSQALGEPLRVHGIVARRAEETRVCDLLERVGIDPVMRNRYPHELSGGQKQRVCIARALAVEPRLLILDEAVSALDVSVQAQILMLLSSLKEKSELSYLFITHDLGVVRQFADRVFVMYLGRIVEVAETEALFSEPRHPYTRALLAAVPRLEVGAMKGNLVLRGDVPSALSPPAGCRFHTRCPEAFERCAKEEPDLYDLGRRQARCFLVEGDA